MTESDTFLLVGNGPYTNRGCEAIVRGTVKILRSAFGSPTSINANFDAAAPPGVPSEPDPGIVHRPLAPVRRLTWKWATVKMVERLHPATGRRLRFGALGRQTTRPRAALSVGGDNYTLDYGVPRTFIEMGKYLKRCGIPTIVWGASIGPFEQRPDWARAMFTHLRQDISGIFVREKRSYDYLVANGLGARTYLMPDPAFVMDPVPVDARRIGPDIPSGRAIGVNVSPLMARYLPRERRKDLRQMTARMIEALRHSFGRPIILIPHVTSPHSNDYTFLQSVRGLLPSDGQVHCLPDDLSAAETKGIVGQLSCLVAARTHATIAAFSSCVPAVSLAYSRKAYGLNELLFGHTDYVVSPEELTPERVVEKTDSVLRQGLAIRNRLGRYMDEAQRQAREAGAALKHLLESRS